METPVIQYNIPNNGATIICCNHSDSILWIFGNQLLVLDNNYRIYENCLIILTLSLEMEGNYTCLLNNNGTITKSTTQIVLTHGKYKSIP